MGRHERPLDPTAGALQAFAADLRELRRNAGGPSYRVLADRAGYSASALAAAAGGTTFPSLPVTLAYVGACDGDPVEWARRWHEVSGAVADDADPVPVLPVAAPPPRELPLDVYGFTGRDRELAELDRLLDAATGGLAAIAGAPGVGKTALAVHWAHRVMDRYPDGCLYVDLRGYDPDPPMRPAEALAACLRALGSGGGRPVGGLTEQIELAATYRRRLAGRRLLIVLDNAHSADQVRPLLPGTGSCTVLVTSRDSLAGLAARDGARWVDLAPLPADDSVALLRTLRKAQVDADPQAATALAGHCAGLPLALRLAAELAAARPGTPLAEVAAELADEHRRLDRLDAGADERTTVRSVFFWSYRALPPDQARLFRLLGLHPGNDFDGYAATTLAGGDLDRCRHLLDELAQAHLVRETAPGRFGMPALLRAYASDLGDTVPGPDRRAALTRLVHLYLATAGAAMDAVYPYERHRRPRVAAACTPAAPVGDAARAREWLSAEQANLVAVTGLAARIGLATHAGHLAAILAGYLDAGGHDADAVAVHGYALAAARTAGDRYGEVAALRRLGRAHWRLGDRERARECWRAAHRRPERGAGGRVSRSRWF